MTDSVLVTEHPAGDRVIGQLTLNVEKTLNSLTREMVEIITDRLEVALACDIRIAEEQAALALPEARVGLLPCAGGTQRLTQLVGEGWAKRMILCGERIGAQQAQTLGLVEEVVPTGEALATATALAAKVGNQSPTSVAACKRLIHSARNIAIADGLVAERDEFVALFSTEDQQEGTNAFLEKREPEWKNQ